MEFKKTNLEPFGLLIEPLKAGSKLQDVDVNTLRDLVHSDQLIILRGFQTFDSVEDLVDYSSLWGEISVWPFGKVLELVEQNNPEDHIFDNNYVPLHWDGMYRPQVPEFQLFHCVKAPLQGKGGRTTFSNTIKVLKNATANNLELWKKVTGSYQRKMEFYDSKTIAPIIESHPIRGFSVIRYNEPPKTSHGKFLNPPILEFTGVSLDKIEAFHSSLQSALYAPENFYAHEWQQGDVVIADNFSLLHGREGFETKTPRHLRRVHILSNPALNNPNLVSYK